MFIRIYAYSCSQTSFGNMMESGCANLAVAVQLYDDTTTRL